MIEKTGCVKSGHRSSRRLGGIALLMLSATPSIGHAATQSDVWLVTEGRPFSYTQLPTVYLSDGRAAYWNISDDFSLLLNPAGQWSSGYSNSRTSPFILASTVGIPLGSGVLGWFNPLAGSAPAVLYTPIFVTMNIFGADVTLPAKRAGLQPSNAGLFAAVKWTCPETGQYQVDAQFTGRSTSETGTSDIVVLRDGLSMYYSLVRDPRQIVLLQTTQDLTAGETFEFRVGRGIDTAASDLKMLEVVIQRVPRICVGDIDGNGRVDTGDIAILLSWFGQQVPPSDGGDLNGDGIVNSADLSLLLNGFGCTV